MSISYFPQIPDIMKLETPARLLETKKEKTVRSFNILNPWEYEPLVKRLKVEQLQKKRSYGFGTLC